MVAVVVAGVGTIQTDDHGRRQGEVSVADQGLLTTLTNSSVSDAGVEVLHHEVVVDEDIEPAVATALPEQHLELVLVSGQQVPEGDRHRGGSRTGLTPTNGAGRRLKGVVRRTIAKVYGVEIPALVAGHELDAWDFVEGGNAAEGGVADLEVEGGVSTRGDGVGEFAAQIQAFAWVATGNLANESGYGIGNERFGCLRQVEPQHGRDGQCQTGGHGVLCRR